MITADIVMYTHKPKEVPMGLMDDMQAKAGDIMNDPKAREEIEKIAREENVSIDAAREHFMKKND